MDRDAVVIEVGLNEAAMRVQNPHVPYTPQECGEDGARCAAAGASVIHWHARDPDTGLQRLGDTDLYAPALVAMRAAGVLAYPTYPIDVDTVDERLGHCWALRDRYGLEMTPVDIGSVTIVTWDRHQQNFGPGLERLREMGVVANSLLFTLDALDRTYALGMVPSLGAFDVGFTRTMVLLTEAGKLRPPVFHKIFVSGAWAVGPFPSEQAIDFHLAQLPGDLEVEWVVVPYALDDPALVERLCRHALERGGGIRVGIGDNPAAFPDATNASLVEHAVKWAADAGRPVAEPDDVRRRLGLAP
jgi:3-keto-5-aminohexanoate cleavage enzyme